MPIVAGFGSLGANQWGQFQGSSASVKDSWFSSVGYTYDPYSQNYQAGDVAIDSDGNTIVLEYRAQQYGSLNLLKYDPKGVILWRKTWNVNDYGAAAGFRPTRLTVDQANHIYLTGYVVHEYQRQDPWDGTYSTDQVTHGAIVKLNANGSLAWRRSFGQEPKTTPDQPGYYSTYNPFNEFYDSNPYTSGICLDGQGNVIALGTFRSYTRSGFYLINGIQGLWVAKYTSSGNPVWVKWVNANVANLYYDSTDHRRVLFANSKIYVVQDRSQFETPRPLNVMTIINADGSQNAVKTVALGRSIDCIYQHDDGNTFFSARRESERTPEGYLFGRSSILGKLNSSGSLVWAKTTYYLDKVLDMELTAAGNLRAMATFGGGTNDVFQHDFTGAGECTRAVVWRSPYGVPGLSQYLIGALSSEGKRMCFLGLDFPLYTYSGSDWFATQQSFIINMPSSKSGRWTVGQEDRTLTRYRTVYDPNYTTYPEQTTVSNYTGTWGTVQTPQGPMDYRTTFLFNPTNATTSGFYREEF